MKKSAELEESINAFKDRVNEMTEFQKYVEIVRLSIWIGLERMKRRKEKGI